MSSVNSVTQACMSFTSQNYGVRKYKRMDKVLIDCIIISVARSLYSWMQRLLLWTGDPADLYKRFGGNPVRNGDSCVYHGTIFPVWNYGSVSGSSAWNGAFRCAHDLICDRNGRNQNCMDLRNFPESQISVCVVLFPNPCILDPDHCHAGDLFLFCQTKSIIKVHKA